jgi:GPN-loop GTPase
MWLVCDGSAWSSCVFYGASFLLFLLQNIEWLKDKLKFYDDNLYLVFDLPGQIELYSHFPFMRHLVRKLESCRVSSPAIYMLDSHFMADPARFFGGSVTPTSKHVRTNI